MCLIRTCLLYTSYVDDLLVTSSSWEEHCDRVERVLKKLSDNHVTLKLEKSKLIANEVQFLGFNLSRQGITPVSYTHLDVYKRQVAPS